ncbi:MAG: aminotransferase class I/II-fold pyridoxal phosphate-dependent enzyme [Candidatus Bathyarchaeota archaeon]|nr:aminotransferase class I/II-fold pyridoxal phosphate-dependent enzyme [Candidatus Bathyarchaeota archaeon]
MVDIFIEKRLASMKPRSHARVVAMARGMKDVVNLGGGDPDFNTPGHITDALIKALKEGKTHYPPNHGLPVLRSVIAEYHGQHGVDWAPSEAIVTAGSGVSLFVSMAGTVNPGEEVILLEPYFMAYSNLAEYVGAREVGVALDEDRGYRLDIEALKENVTPKTKMIVLCNPNNPSGTVFTEEELRGISDLVLDNDLLVLSDEVYCEFIWDGLKHVSIASLPDMKERTIISSSFSKAFAMTGWRLGYLLADEAIIKRLQKIPIGYRTNTFVQLAGVEALKGPWGPVEEMKKEYDRRRRFMVPRLDGISCHMPEGAFYLFPRIDDLRMESETFCESLLRKKKILARPGKAFGVTGEHHMRIPLIKPVEVLEEIAVAIEDHVNKSSR